MFATGKKVTQFVTKQNGEQWDGEGKSGAAQIGCEPHQPRNPDDGPDQATAIPEDGTEINDHVGAGPEEEARAEGRRRYQCYDEQANGQ